MESRLLSSYIGSAYHKCGTSYMEANTYEVGLNPFFYDRSYMDAHHSVASYPPDYLTAEESDHPGGNIDSEMDDE